jgi:CPA2 family monovalent cation:H+ antiporter-2
MQAREANPDLLIIARAHSEEEVLHLKKHGASIVIMGEEQIARAMIEDVRNAVAAENKPVDTRGAATAPVLAE